MGRKESLKNFKVAWLPWNYLENNHSNHIHTKQTQKRGTRSPQFYFHELRVRKRKKYSWNRWHFIYWILLEYSISGISTLWPKGQINSSISQRHPTPHTHTKAKKCFLHGYIAKQIKRRICYMKFKLQYSQVCGTQPRPLVRRMSMAAPALLGRVE